MAVLGCGGAKAPTRPSPAFVVVGADTAPRAGEVPPPRSPYFDGEVISVALARGEALALVVVAPGARQLAVELADVDARLSAIGDVVVRTPSTAMYGGGRGAGRYGDRLGPPTAGIDTPRLLELEAPVTATPGRREGHVIVDGRRWPLAVDVRATQLPNRAAHPWLWSYYDPRELGADAGVRASAEAQCQALFRRHGVVASPMIALADADARLSSVAGSAFVPVWLPADEASVTADVRAWIARTAGSGQVPFAIPVDEPRTPAAWARVREVAGWVRAAGGGPGRFLFAVTAAPSPDDGGQIDVYVTPRAMRIDRPAPPPEAWTYNGKPPSAGALVVDAAPGSLRAWGAIAWRWRVPLWYVWDGLYWHDRHNRKRRGEPILDGEPLARVSRDDAVTFDDGEDRGNLDGVLAYPADGGCAPSLRLVQLRRAVDDRALLDAAACRDDAARLAEEVVPRALADASTAGAGGWPTTDSGWETWRRRVLDAADACGTR